MQRTIIKLNLKIHLKVNGLNYKHEILNTAKKYVQTIGRYYVLMSNILCSYLRPWWCT